MLVSIVFGAVWGILWGLLSGGCYIIRLFDGRDPLSQLLRNLVSGGLAYLAAYLLFGEMAYSFVGLLIAIVFSIPLENFLRGYSGRRQG